MQVKLNLFPGGRRRALTMSYDDGVVYDRRLVEIFNQYGIKGTFHLNSGRLNLANMEEDGVPMGLYRGHEVSSHMKNHPYPNQLPDATLIDEIFGDRANLEKLCGYPVRGMSYPYGIYNDHIIEIAKNCGMEYSRTVASTNGFNPPDDFMKWHPTVHHKGDLNGLWDRFMNAAGDAMLLFYIWGHSYEFAREDNWEIIENFCKMAGGRDDVWYATNIEIKDYITAQRNLVVSADGTMIYNPSCLDVWVRMDEEPVRIKAGSILS
ncbi:MAG: polysaccharide deacetylase family protein [Lachnospiraceae bacterium]|nr:polysaccharide deacetylase family protein [Lachnospiraceae bacterium]